MYNIGNNLRKGILESTYTIEDYIDNRLIKYCEDENKGDFSQLKQYFINVIDEENPESDNTEEYYKVIDHFLNDQGY